MKKILRPLIFLLIAVVSFMTGYWVHHEPARVISNGERRILYYVDPMNPSYKSDKPGISPACGMPLEPVYEESSSTNTQSIKPPFSLPPGAVQVPPAKQQLIGLHVVTVENSTWQGTVRLLGRVAADETRSYQINAPIDCWIKKVLPVTTGSMVRKNELLATFYSPDYRTAVLTYLNTLKNDPAMNVPKEEKIQKRATPGRESRNKEYVNTQSGRYIIGTTGHADYDSLTEVYKKLLLNFGMSEYQLEEMQRTRIYVDNIEIRSPARGFILSRNVSPGLRVEQGSELFRIADLSKVWIQADLFENEDFELKPGISVKLELPYQKKIIYARVSNVLPWFDSATRTFKVRLEADNPGFAMRPDMFVNVEFPVTGPPGLAVPLEAVLDSGLRKTVFIDLGNGYFEPRLVETGRTIGELVEIKRGLMPGEKIVVSGNFFLDSETRMQQMPQTTVSKGVRDLVCGMDVDMLHAKKTGNFREYKGKSYFFCTPECRDLFAKDPQRYMLQSTEQIPPSAQNPSPGSTKHMHHNALGIPGSHDTAPMTTTPKGREMHPMKGPHESSPQHPAGHHQKDALSTTVTDDDSPLSELPVDQDPSLTVENLEMEEQPPSATSEHRHD